MIECDICLTLLSGRDMRPFPGKYSRVIGRKINVLIIMCASWGVKGFSVLYSASHLFQALLVLLVDLVAWIIPKDV